jgi:hypothetical protein
MLQWPLEYRVFVYDSFLKSGQSIIETQRPFRCRFMGTFQVRNNHLEVGHIFFFEKEGTIMVLSQLHEPTGEREKSEREAMVRSPTRSARRHAVKLEMRESRVTPILNKMACNNVSFSDYK